MILIQTINFVRIDGQETNVLEVIKGLRQGDPILFLNLTLEKIKTAKWTVGEQCIQKEITSEITTKLIESTEKDASKNK